MKRESKKVLALGMVSVMFALTACGSKDSTPAASSEAPAETASAETGTDAKRFDGTTLYMIAEQQTPTESLKKQLSLFEEETGIKVELEMAPYDDVIQKETLAFESGSGAYDIIAAPY